MLVKDYKPKIGDIVETNGTARDEIPFEEEIVKGMVGEIRDGFLYIWHNNKKRDGGRGMISPEKGYKYSWAVNLENKKAWIKVRPAIINDLVKIKFLNKDFKMTEKAREALKFILGKYEKK